MENQYTGSCVPPGYCSFCHQPLAAVEERDLARQVSVKQRSDCSTADDGGTHWLSGCECQARRHMLLETEHRAAKNLHIIELECKEDPLNTELRKQHRYQYAVWFAAFQSVDANK